jgi:hypothetical protein
MDPLSQAGQGKHADMAERNGCMTLGQIEGASYHT